MSSRAGIFALALCVVVFNAAGAEGMNTFKTGVAGELRYDSNTDPGSHDSSEDFIFSLAPELEFINERQNARFDALYRFTGNSYLKESDRSYVGHQAGAGADIRLSENTGVRAAYDFIFTREAREGALTGIETSRAGTHSHLVTFNATHTLSPKTSVALDASESFLEYEDPLLVDTRTDAAGITVIYRISDNTSVSPAYSFTNMAFDTQENVESHLAGVSAKHILSPTLELNASGGLVYSTVAGDGRIDWQAGAGFVKTLPKGSFSGSYSRSIGNASGLADKLNMNDRLSAALSHSLAERLSVAVSASYSIDRTSPGDTVDIRSYNAGIAALWQARQWLQVGAQYSYFNQDSRGASGRDAQENVIGVNFFVRPFEYRN